MGAVPRPYSHGDLIRRGTKLLNETLSAVNRLLVDTLCPLQLRVQTQIPHSGLHNVATLGEQQPDRPTEDDEDEEDIAWVPLEDRGGHGVEDGEGDAAVVVAVVVKTERTARAPGASGQRLLLWASLSRISDFLIAAPTLDSSYTSRQTLAAHLGDLLQRNVSLYRNHTQYVQSQLPRT